MPGVAGLRITTLPMASFFILDMVLFGEIDQKIDDFALLFRGRPERL